MGTRYRAAATAMLGACVALALAALGHAESDPRTSPEIPVSPKIAANALGASSITHMLSQIDLQTGDQVLVGDWDRDGYDSLGVRRGQQILLSDDGSAVLGDYASYSFGSPRARAVVGSWGTLTDTVALHQGITVDLRRWFTNGPADRSFGYGNPGDDIFSGDWNGDGYSGPGVRRADTFYIKADATTGVADDTFIFAPPGGVVLIGDFNGDGRDDVAVRHDDTVRIRHELASGEPDEIIHLPSADIAVVVGDFDGDGQDTIELAEYPEGSAPTDAAAKSETAAPTPSATQSSTAQPSPSQSTPEDDADQTSAKGAFDHVVGESLQPGVYRITSGNSVCSVSVLYSDGTPQSGQIVPEQVSGVYVSLAGGDKLSATGCAMNRVEPAGDNAPDTVPSDGEWLVGVDVAAGSYRVSGDSNCFATVLQDASRDADMVTSVAGKDGDVELEHGQLVSSDGCIWSKR